jgi:hypothetical protein
LKTKLEAVLKKNPRYKDKLLLSTETQNNNTESHSLPQINVAGQQKKPMMPMSEKGKFLRNTV